MKKLLINGLLFWFISQCQIILSQTDTLFYINSSFETLEDQAKWSSLPTHETVKWTYYNGGHSYPLIAKSGTKNAVFYWSDFNASYYRTLVSQSVDLSAAEKPQLTFWRSQAAFIGQDELTLLFRTGPAAPWDTIQKYQNRQDDWTQEVFNLDEFGTKYLVNGFQIGFLGLANSGQGVCLDSILLKETASIDKFVKSISYKDVEHQVVAAKTKQLPLIRVEIEISGNNGTSTLNNISFRLSQGNASWFKSNGFRLYKTSSDVYKSKESGTSTQLGTAVSISGNVISFSGLTKNLSIGKNYLWLAADFADVIPNNSVIAFIADANSIKINTEFYPASTTGTLFTANVLETYFYDNFDTSVGWTLGGDFEIAAPMGLKYINSKDPAYAYSGTKVMGTDLTDDGAHPDTIVGYNAYFATSPVFNLKYYNNIKVYMRKWIDFSPLDRASIEFSTNQGNSWTIVWDSQIDNPTASTDWGEIYFGQLANEMLSRNDSIQVRFGLLETNSINPRTGFNIDNFTVAANHLEKDLAITQIISPYNDCIGTGNNTVQVVVRNFADGPSTTNIPVYFGLWGVDSTLVHETIPGPIAKDDSVVFTFTTPANFPMGDIYPFVVGVQMAGDEDVRNDTLTKQLHIQDNFIPPVNVDFEFKGGLWIPSENSTWSCRTPDGSIPVISQKSWILSPFGDYINDDNNNIESSCYDLTFANRHIVELNYWLNSEVNKDGFSVEYTVNDGASWQLVDSSQYSSYWNWYQQPVTALGTIGWSGNSGGWTIARELLPVNLKFEPKVKFRLNWASDANVNARGMAFDNFKVYPAPADIGASWIQSPQNACQNINSDIVGVYFTNFGPNKIAANEQIPFGVDFIGQNSLKDTLQLITDLLPGDSILASVVLPMNINLAGNYTIRSYSQYDINPWFYGTNNDTVTKTFAVWPNPITLLPDTISSREPDTVVIKPHFDINYNYLWGDNSTNSQYNISLPGTYYLTVTEVSHGCQTEDSVYIELLFNDVGVQAITWPQSDCEMTTSEKVTLSIKNFGTDSLILGDKIRMSYRINNGAIRSDSLTLSESFLSKSILEFTFNNPTENLSLIGYYTIKAWANCGGDTISLNDTINDAFEVFGYPTLNIGVDTVVTALNYPINPGTGFSEYLWNDGDTNSFKQIDSSGLWWLQVIDENGCPASDSINIWLRIRDIMSNAIINPVSACNRTGTDQVTVQIKNNGSDTLTLSDNITVSYKLNNGTKVSKTISVNQLKPTQTYNLTFDPVLNITPVGNYNFEVVSSTANDLRKNNDTLVNVISTNTNPIVDLGVNESTFYKTTALVLDAGPGSNYSYLWQDGSTNQTFTVTDIMQVKVLVTNNTTGCFGGDTAIVNLDILDYKITSVGIDETSCSNTYNNVTVTILNNGNLPRASADILLTYFLNSNELFTENYKENRNWVKGGTRTYQTISPIDLNALGTSQLKVNVSHTGDLRPENDDYLKSVQVIPSPEVDFGGDTINVEFPHVLNAGAGHQSYLWTDNSTNSTLTVNNAGGYGVIVTGNNGCITNRSVLVQLATGLDKVNDDQLKVKIYPNPAQDFINIEAEMIDPKGYAIEIFNAQSGIVFSEKITETNYSNKLSLQNLPSGVYLVRISNESTNHISKFIIQ